MLNAKLNRDQSLAGRSVEMTISATGQIVDAYDVYIDIYGHVKNHYCVDDPQYQMLYRQIFVRLIFWETTHKKLVIGTVTVLDGKDLPKEAIEDLERCSVPIEKKDYWKKTFEKMVVVDLSNILASPENLPKVRELWCKDNHKVDEPDKACNINIFSVMTCPIASYEFTQRNQNLTCCPASIENGGESDGESPQSKCWEGPHGFVRSDSADEFDQRPTSLPVTLDIK